MPRSASPPGSMFGAGIKQKPLTILPLVVLVFFEVSGGPFGTEDSVASGGPLLTMLGYLILPLVWSVPEALVTAELATAFPENSGYVAWVTAAFGPFWGFQEGLLKWISGVTDNSLYPVMLAANMELFFPQLASGPTRTYFLIGMSLMLSYLNYRGLNVVGHAVITSCVAIVIPFLIFVILAAPKVEPSNWIQSFWLLLKWSQATGFWNLNYWDAVSTLAGEVENPGYTFPRAMMWAVLLVVMMYLLPSMAALGITTDKADWTLGCYGRVAQKIGGNWLAVWILVASACSQIGQYQAEMASDSYQGMAERGFLPKFLAKRSKHDTPTLAIILSSVGVLCLTAFNFVEIVTLLNATYCVAELLQYAAYIWLRIKHPNLPRPFKIPLPTFALVLMLTPAVFLLFVVLVLPVYTGDTTTIFFITGALLFGFILYPTLQFVAKKGWLEFEPLHFEVPGVYGPTATEDYPEQGAPEDGLAGEEEEEDIPPSMCHHNMRVESVVPGLRALVEARSMSMDLDRDSLNQPLLRGNSQPVDSPISRNGVPEVEPPFNPLYGSLPTDPLLRKADLRPSFLRTSPPPMEDNEPDLETVEEGDHVEDGCPVEAGGIPEEDDVFGQ
eukprot:gene6811-30783_t